MKALYALYPDNPDAATLYAAALMNLSPWDYWWNDGRPHDATRIFLKVLEGAIATAADPSLGQQMGLSSPGEILELAMLSLEGEIAARRGQFEKAIPLLQQAVRLQDAMSYNEPPDWHYPIRQSLGAVLLEAGRPKEAEVVYWEDLRHNSDNGWSLFGLLQSVKAQGKIGVVEQVEARFQKAWAEADVTLPASRF